MRDIILNKLRAALLKESLNSAMRPPVHEAEPKSDNEPKSKAPEKKQDGPPLSPEKGDKGAEALYASVSKALKNPMLNHAEIIRHLWPDSDNASARSLFRKKLEREKMTNGEGHYSFTQEELIKIRNIINSAGKAIVASSN